MLPTSLPGGILRDRGRPADLAPGGQAGQVGHGRRLQGRPAAQRGEGLVGRSVRYAHDVTHEAEW